MEGVLGDVIIRMDASILRYMMYCIMLLVLVDRYHTTSGMVYYPLGLTPTMYMMHCIVGVLGVEREGYIHHVVYLHQ